MPYKICVSETKCPQATFTLNLQNVTKLLINGEINPQQNKVKYLITQLDR